MTTPLKRTRLASVCPSGWTGFDHEGTFVCGACEMPAHCAEVGFCARERDNELERARREIQERLINRNAPRQSVELTVVERKYIRSLIEKDHTARGIKPNEASLLLMEKLLWGGSDA